MKTLTTLIACLYLTLLPACASEADDGCFDGNDYATALSCDEEITLYCDADGESTDDYWDSFYTCCADAWQGACGD